MFSNNIFAKGYGILRSSLNYSRNDISPTLMKTFGIFGVVNFPLFYLLWSFFPGQEYNGMPLRMIAFVMCFFLALMDYWPQRLKSYLYAYWYLTIFYCLPFFGAYLFLENSMSSTWITNNILGLLWLVLVTDWLTFIVILPLGILAGCFVHYCIVGPVQLPPDFISGPLTNYIWAIVIAIIFGKILHESKLNAMRTLAGAMAHELRTPLGGISLIAQVLKMHIPALVTGYKQAKEVNPDLDDAD
ncbi:MAG: hypothetical protein K2W94_08300, partial [Alphaproteobacteria bacterium]|nr:hypothetical protein [Alphaproteobacteria bacterium]